MKRNLFFLLCFAAVAQLHAQKSKPVPPARGSFQTEQVRRTPSTVSIPAAENPFQLPAAVRTPLPAFSRYASAPKGVKSTLGDAGLPIFWTGIPEGYTDNSTLSPEARAQAYVAAIRPAGIRQPGQEFRASSVSTDEQGNLHVRLQQEYAGIPVYGAELVAHTGNGTFNRLNGRYVVSPNTTATTAAISADNAVERVKSAIGTDKLKKSWSEFELKMVGGQPFRSRLVWYCPEEKGDNARLAWHIEAHPNLLDREIYFIDALDGAVLFRYRHVCTLHPALEGAEHAAIHHLPTPAETLDAALVVGPVTATGTDLTDTLRSFGAWDLGGNQVVLEDASKPMFNSSASQMPNDPVGAIVTLNALNTSPEVQSTFDYNFVVSANTTFSDKTAVSAHYNSIKSYDYFKNKFNRNSIDGVGGNIIAFYNVAESDGSSMENAFWNGEAMWYGNGGSTFKKLARGLDVGGHEMTHGVVEKTANLEYLNESGALNESFADIFGAMIDRADWKIGEDVMQSGANPSGALRDLQDPHNGVSAGSSWWQPKFLSEKYTGTQDNGGVHINSGIANYAYYLFATNAQVGKDKAEQVYYKALRDYLVKSSKFIDCRLAVIQAATDLYGATVANAAASAFNTVGIVGNQPGGNYLGQLSPNPGFDLILCVSEDDQNVNIGIPGQVLGTIYSSGVSSRPSIADNGQTMIFVNADGDIVTVDLTYNGTNVSWVVNPPFSASPIWRNAALSKDGRFIAAITNTQDNRVYLWDLADPFQIDPIVFFLTNPTYSQDPTNTSEVRYADVLDFDYSGQYLMYDAFNELSNQQGDDISYWDIGFLKFWENGQFASTQNPFISKLFSGLPENVSVGDPTFAKNSPYIIAFDVIDAAEDQYDIYGANTETGDFSPIVTDNGALGWPNYSRLDDRIIFERPFITGGYDLFQQAIKPSKIEALGTESNFIDFNQWGVWFSNGSRSLMVGTTALDDPQMRVSLSPNPAVDVTQLSINAAAATEARVVLSDLTGRILQQRQVNLQAGDNQLSLEIGHLPAGAYLVQVQAANGGQAALKVLKN